MPCRLKFERNSYLCQDYNLLTAMTERRFTTFLEDVIGLPMQSIIQEDSSTIDSFIEKRLGADLKLGSDSRLIYRGNPSLDEGRISTENVSERFDAVFGI